MLGKSPVCQNSGVGKKGEMLESCQQRQQRGKKQISNRRQKNSFQPMLFARLPTRTQERQPERIVHCGLHPRIHGVHRLYVDAPDKSSGKRRPASWKAATTKPKLPSVWATVFAMTIISFYLFSSCRLPPRFREEPFYYPTAFRDEPKNPRPHAAARKQTRILPCI
mgnify:CR=1 FL=1